MRRTRGTTDAAVDWRIWSLADAKGQVAGPNPWFRDRQHHLEVAPVHCPTWHVICVSFRARAALHGCPTDRRCRANGAR